MSDVTGCERLDLNQRPSPYEGAALTGLSYVAIYLELPWEIESQSARLGRPATQPVRSEAK